MISKNEMVMSLVAGGRDRVKEPVNHQKEAAEVQSQVDAFLAAGGKIQKINSAEFGYKMPERFN